MKTEEIRGLDSGEILEKVANFKKELLNLRIELKTGKLEKHGRIRTVRKDIARLLTILTQKEKGLDVPVKTEVEHPKKTAKKGQAAPAKEEAPKKAAAKKEAPKKTEKPAKAKKGSK